MTRFPLTPSEAFRNPGFADPHEHPCRPSEPAHGELRVEPAITSPSATPPTWVEVHTGGGCMALRMEGPNGGYALATRLDGASLPVKGRKAWIGLYDASDNQRGPISTVTWKGGNYTPYWKFLDPGH